MEPTAEIQVQEILETRPTADQALQVRPEPTHPQEAQDHHRVVVCQEEAVALAAVAVVDPAAAVGVAEVKIQRMYLSI